MESSATVDRPSFLRLAFFVCLAGLMLTLPYSIKFSNLFMLLTLLFSGLLAWHEQTARRPLWTDYLMWGMYACVIVGFFSALSSRAWQSEIETALPFLVMPAIFCLSYKALTKVFVERLMKVFVGGVMFSCLLAHAIVLHRMREAGDGFDKAFEHYYTYVQLARPIGIEPTYFSLYVILSVFFLLYFLGQTKLVGKVLVILGILYGIFFLFLLSSRIGIITFLASAVVLMILHLKRTARLVALGAAAVLFVVLVVYIKKVPLANERFKAIQTDAQSLFSSDSAQVYDRRVIIYRCGWRLSQQVSPMGYGAGYTQQELNACYRTAGFEDLATDNFGAHSEYFNTLLTYGWIGLIVFILILGAAAWWAFTQRDMLAMVLSIMMILPAVVESTFSRQKGLVFFLLFYGLLISTRMKQTTPVK